MIGMAKRSQIRLPLGFDEALRDLLRIKPPAKKTAPTRKSKRQPKAKPKVKR
jgi:hypothetical protein